MVEQLKNFVEQSVSDTFCDTCRTTEDWLYDEGDDAQKSEYVKRLTELKYIFSLNFSFSHSLFCVCCLPLLFFCCCCPCVLVSLCPFLPSSLVKSFCCIHFCQENRGCCGEETLRIRYQATICQWSSKRFLFSS